ncbi:MAG: PEGA domain-containing protein [Patescibacteria group bacterium]
MTIRTRRVLFYSLFFLFIFIGLAVVLYSFGWRISAENCSAAEPSNCFQKTGGLFIETEPKGVVIKIDGKIFKDKSGLIQNGTLIKNLSPKTYKIKVEKDGFLPYEKKVKIESNLVAEIPNIVLIPEKLEKISVPVPKSIDNFWISPQQKIVFKSNGVLYYFNADLRGLNADKRGQNTNPFKLKGDEFVGFSEDGGKIIVSASQTYYLYDLNDLSKTVNLSAVFKNLKKNAILDKIAFHPADSNRLIVKDKNARLPDGQGYLYFLDLNRLKLEIITEEPVFFWTVKNPNIYYIKARTDADLTQTNANNTRNSPAYALNSFNLILKTENIIAQFPNSQIILSPDNKKIAFFNKAGDVNIYFLEDYRFGINKKAGDVINLNLYEGKTIKNIFWYKDSYHLLVEYEGKVDFIEIDDRAPINKYTLIDSSAPPAINYDLKSNKIYFLADKNIYYSAINGD